MKLLKWAKDGGPKSPVDAFFIIECKKLFSIAILKFNKGCREEYHDHAFNALTWFVKGKLIEEPLNWDHYFYRRSLIPKFTPRSNMHRVIAAEDSWCLTIRGPWSKFWHEYNETTNKYTVLTHGRKVVELEHIE